MAPGATKKGEKSDPTIPNETQTTKLPWPSLKEKWKLQIDTVIPSQILTIRNLLSTDECNKFIQSLNNHKVGLGALVRFETTNPTPKRGEAFRLNDRITVFDPHFAQVLWFQTGLKKIFERWFASSAGQDHEDDVIFKRKCWGLNPNIRIYRYQVGHRFEKHFDDSVKISTLGHPDILECLALQTQSNPSKSANTTQTSSDLPNVLSTEYTLLIYLTGSDSCGKNAVEEENLDSPENKLTTEILVGGETVFYSNKSPLTKPSSTKKRSTNLDKKAKESPRDKQKYDDPSILASIEPIAGLALIHRHGSKCLLHEGREVLSGVKYVLRSDIMFG